jgi:hypothetical protein
MGRMHRSGIAAIHIVLWLILVIGLMALSFWAGTTVEDWPRGPAEDDNSRLAVYGYVQVELRRGTPSLLAAPAETQDYTGLRLEQRTQASMLETRALLDAVIQNPQLETRKTKWFQSFDKPNKARKWLEKHFHADAVSDSKLIRVWLDPIDSQKEARTIVMDIVNTHLDQQRRLAQGKMLDRMQALNSLKTKYDIRIRELSDRQNNLMLRMQMGGQGSSDRYTTTDLELKDATARRGVAYTAAQAARAEFEQRAATVKDGDPSLQEPQRAMQKTQAIADAVNKQVDQLKSVLGDLAIAMSDYLNTVDELKVVHAAAKEVRDQMDIISAQSTSMVVDWAQRPSARDTD